MKIIPLEDRVVLQLKEPESITSGGVKLPQDSQPKSNLATVIAVGEGRQIDAETIIKPKVAVNDIVIISDQWVGSDIEVDNVKFKIVRSTDILGVLNG